MMDYVTVSLAEELNSSGFSYKHYKENPHKGMVFYYENEEWIIGGQSDGDFSDEELKIINNGIWLPSQVHLMEWLEDNDFVYAIVNNDGFYEVICKDIHTNTQFQTKMPTLSYTLAKTIKKILKKHEREFDTKEKLFGTIIEYDTVDNS